MTTNTNGDSSSPQTPDPDQRKKFSLDGLFHGLGLILFIICWVVAGVIIFNILMNAGIFVVFSVLGAIIGGFIAAVVVFIMGAGGV